MVRGSNPLISNVKRSKWKPVIDYSFGKESSKKTSLDRAQVIKPSDVNTTVIVENGLLTKGIKVSSDHVGHRCGEFFQSKKRVVFKNNKK